MTTDALARLEAPLHHLISHSLFLCFRQLGQRRVLADLVEAAVVDGHGGFACCAGAASAAEQRFGSRASMYEYARSASIMGLHRIGCCAPQ